MKRLACLALMTLMPLNAALAHDPAATIGATTQLSPGTRVTLVYEQKIPNLPGKSIKGVLVEYDPGGANPAHIHAKSAIIYATVLEGAVLNRLNDGPVRTFTKGQNFTEMPGDRHYLSANASKTEPARLLAVFVVDTDDTALTTPLPH